MTKTRQGWATTTGIALFVAAFGLALILLGLVTGEGIKVVGFLIALPAGAVAAVAVAYGLIRTRWSISTAIGLALCVLGALVMFVGTLPPDATTALAALQISTFLIFAGAVTAAVGIGIRLIRQ